MDSLEWGVLEVCREVILRQQEMLPRLAAVLQVPEDRVFYTWAFRRCEQRGRLNESEWGYFFHGLECDLTNGTDGRFLRLDFGPRGRMDTFTAWGILQFLLTSVSPWKEFAALKAYFGKGLPPFNPYSGSLEKFTPVWNSLTAAGAFEKADPSLLALESKYTFRGSDGLATIRFPPEIAEETILDCKVARRERLSPHARQLLALHENDYSSRLLAEK